MNDLDLLIDLFSALAWADQSLSSEEFSALFHAFSSRLPEQQVFQVIRRLQDSATLGSQVLLDRLVERCEGMSRADRCALILMGYDFAAHDGIDRAEERFLLELAARLGIAEPDLQWILWGIEPQGSAPEIASESIRVVHVGTGPGDSVPLETSADLTLFQVRDKRFLRVRKARTVVRLDERPVPLHVLLEIAPTSRLVCRPYRLEAGDIDQLLESAGQSGSSLGQAVRLESLADSMLSLPDRPMETDQGLPGKGRVAALTVRGLSYRVPSGRDPKILVDNVSFRANRGELIAILGPSGCGKTTLLEMLSGRRCPSSGDILLRIDDRDVPVAGEMSRVGLVPQDEVLLPQLSVRENVDFACRLRNPRMSREERQKRVQEAIATVSLEDRASYRVGSPENRLLSGGQRRRVSLAMELVGSPDVMLLDEPLTGLSSFDARMLADVFLDLARQGKIVLVVVHQPSAEIFHLFHKILVLDVGGKMAFFGKPQEGLQYFRTHGVRFRTPPENQESPLHPDLILETLEQRDAEQCQERHGRSVKRIYPPDYWQAVFQHQFRDAMGEAVLSPCRTGRPVSPSASIRDRLAQFGSLVLRNFLARMRNPFSLVLSLLIAPFLGIILAWVVRSPDPYSLGSNPLLPVFLFMVPIVVFFLGMMGSSTEFVLERRLFLHETPLDIPPLFYLLSKGIVILLWTSVETLLFLGISFGILEIRTGFHWSYLLGLLTAAAGVTLGLAISTVAQNVRMAQTLVVVVLIPQILFGGIIPYAKMNPTIFAGDREKLDAPPIAKPIITQWCFEGLVVTHALTNPAARQRELCNCPSARGPEETRSEDELCGEVDALAKSTENHQLMNDFVNGADDNFQKRYGRTPCHYGTPLDGDPRPFVGNVAYARERWLLGRRWLTPVADSLVLGMLGLSGALLALGGLYRLRRIARR
ncbi:MAG TPA: ATP-binding cassette domain-containing protein [Myxococcota bacterium]|nr:ATP-binding cassette domain-containing protein [Myxococcota bacterium]HQK50439.1 ATP-binding cassette domain-containing protein [Myxococcota bacterium]